MNKEKEIQDENLKEKEAEVVEDQAVESPKTDYEDLYVRLQADFDNFRRRSLQDKQTLRKQVKSSVIMGILPVIDNFKRARESFSETCDPVYKDSLVMLEKQFLKILSELGVERFESLNKPFDPNYHEAIAYEDMPSCQDGEICEEFEPGYMLDKDVIRVAKVKVAKNQ